VLISGTAYAADHRVDLYSHLTANRDVPENTIESLETARRFGCDVVEIDIGRARSMDDLSPTSLPIRRSPIASFVEELSSQISRRKDAGGAPELHWQRAIC
jgi:hypothetical protein